MRHRASGADLLEANSRGKLIPDCEELQTKTSSSAQRTGRRKHEQVFHPAVSCLVFHSRKKAQKLIKHQLSYCAADRCRLTSSAKTFSRLYEAENVSKSRRIQLSMNPNVRYEYLPRATADHDLTIVDRTEVRRAKWCRCLLMLTSAFTTFLVSQHFSTEFKTAYILNYSNSSCPQLF